ncbi:hypothetical protein KBB27_01065 [Patescibacteria group bacterium]|nr:hypothetical protein [Patescibacteria group bacterium]
MSECQQQNALEDFLGSTRVVLQKVGARNPELLSTWLKTFVEAVHCTLPDKGVKKAHSEIQAAKLRGCTVQEAIQLTDSYVRAAANAAHTFSKDDPFFIRMSIERSLWRAFVEAGERVGFQPTPEPKRELGQELKEAPNPTKHSSKKPDLSGDLSQDEC